MDLLVTINNNRSDKNTNDSIASTATTSSLPSSLRGKNKIYENKEIESLLNIFVTRG